MDLEVKHLRLVQAIAEEGTQTNASRKLYLTQSALSHQLKELEQRVGTSLFYRLGRTMTPTPAGRRILEAGEKILPQLRELSGELRDLARGMVGEVRISTQCYTCYNWLPHVLPAFRAANPGVEIQIVAEAADMPVTAILDGSLDLALAYDFAGDDSIHLDPLWSDELVAIVHPSHPLARRPFLEARDLADENLILYMDRIEETYFYSTVLKPAGVRPRRTTPVRLTEAIVAMVAGGGGVSVLTRWTVAKEIAAGAVVAVRVTELGVRREWFAVRLAARKDDRALDCLVGLLSGGPLRLFEGPELDDARRLSGIRAGGFD